MPPARAISSAEVQANATPRVNPRSGRDRAGTEGRTPRKAVPLKRPVRNPGRGLENPSMDPNRVRKLLEEVGAGKRGVDAALEELRTLPFADLGYARVDHHRALRQGVPEVILAEGKTAEQVAGIA